MTLTAWVPVAPVGIKGWGGPAEFVHLQVSGGGTRAAELPLLLLAISVLLPSAMLLQWPRAEVPTAEDLAKHRHIAYR
jgi:hypothetical protein